MCERVCKVTVMDIIGQFETFKTKYVDTMDENKALKETVELLSTRLKSKEDQRLKLIGLVKERSEKYRKRVRCLQERNGQLESIIQDQKHSLQEYSKKMIVLDGTATEQSKEIENYLNTINSLKEEVDSLKNELKNATTANNNNNNIINVSNLQISNKRNLAVSKLAHPSFNVDSKKASKQRQSTITKGQNAARRWSNLNIAFNAGQHRGIKDLSSNRVNSNAENDLSASREKRRKLYQPDDDATIDLED